MNRTLIAQELVKLAKSLVASNDAFESGGIDDIMRKAGYEIDSAGYNKRYYKKDGKQIGISIDKGEVHSRWTLTVNGKILKGTADDVNEAVEKIKKMLVNVGIS